MEQIIGMLSEMGEYAVAITALLLLMKHCWQILIHAE